jgi:hypothetical protein
VPCGSLPSTIYETVTAGNCTPGIPDLPMMTFDHVTWNAGATTSCNDGFGYNLQITCTGGNLTITITDGSRTYSGSIIIDSVSPFSAHFTYTALSGGCCAPNSVTLTFTA